MNRGTLQQKRLLTVVVVAISLICIVGMAVGYAAGNMVFFIYCAALFVMYMIALVLTVIFNKVQAAFVFMHVGLAIGFSFSFLIGGNAGLGFFWYLVVPLIMVTLTNTVATSLWCLYCTLFMLVIYATPLRVYIPAEHGGFAGLNYIFVWGFGSLVSIRLGFQMQSLDKERRGLINQLNSIVREERDRNNELILQAIEIISNSVDAKDRYTNQHSIRVSELAGKIAEEMHLSTVQIETVKASALIHDIGKIGIPDSILSKPAPLTTEEYSEIKSHPVKGYEIIKSFDGIKGIQDGVYYHHERFDGTGYPLGLAGDDIPLTSRIISLADAFDAMNSDRAYRKAMSRNEILENIENGRGSQFDPDITDVFMKLVYNGQIHFASV